MSRLGCALLLLLAAGARGEEATIAVAANFVVPAKTLAERFARDTGHKVVLSSGSTGKFFAQIKSGAPFDVLLSADAATPQRLEEEKLAVAGSRFTFAVGKLVLWSARPGVVDKRGEVLRTGSFKRLALANPKLAPYGAAAQQALQKLGLWAAVQPKLVQGENIAQTLQFVASGNAELGFVALSQIREADKPPAGSYWLVPASLHAPIRQDAVLLMHGERNPAAREFLALLRSSAAQDLIRAFGYDLP